jgi:hypothetical protein
MGGAIPYGLGLYYQEDPTGRNEGAIVHKTLTCYQVVVPKEEGWQVIAECLDENHAKILCQHY